MARASDRLHEQVLALRCQAGDDQAFAELVERYHHRLRYYVLRLLNDKHAADDVMQDVWLSVFRNLRQLRSPRALPVWLYRIARNTALRVMRDAQQLVGLTEDLVTAAPTSEPPESSALEKARVQAALERLRPQHREILALRFVEQLNYDQIAAVINRPVGTVRSRLHYAKRALRQEVRG